MEAPSYLALSSHTSLWQYALLLVIAYLIYSLLVAFYRLSLHPLSKYPGPFLSAISSYSIFLQATTGNRHLQSYLEHQIYGPIVRIAPNTLSINTVSALQFIYLSRKANVQKSSWYATIDAPSGAFSTHSEIDRTRHATRRRVLDHAFSDAALRSTETFVLENVRTFCTLLCADSSSSEWSRPRNLSEYSTRLTYDIMGSLVFGQNFACLSQPDQHGYIPELMMSSTAFIYPLAHLPFAWLLRPILANERLMSLLPGKMTRDTAAYIAYANSLMGERITVEDRYVKAGVENPRKDLMHYLLHAKDPLTGQGFSRQELDADASLLIAAGADTSSAALAAALFYLTSNADVLEKLVRELDIAFPDDVEQMRYPKVGQLTYLKAVIDETLRLAPPVPTHLLREVLDGGIEVEGERIPAGTVVGTSAYCIHHNEEYYPDSWAFRPERWIVDDNEEGSKERVKVARDAFCAFSLGSRGCVGKNVAYMELGVALARVVWLFEMKRVNAEVKETEKGGRVREMRRRKDEFQLIDHFLVERDGPVLQFKRRER